jgi:DNA-binding beta-propeller fold protein YncE
LACCRPDKLLCDSLIRGRPGKSGSGPGELNQPRGVTSTPGGDIIVADTLNHRVQIFNSYALFKAELGGRGKGPGEFNQPTDVAVMRNGRIVVADSKNKRVQVFTEDLRFKYMFATSSEPYYVTCDRNHNMVVSTLRRTIEVYRRQGALRHKFELPHQGSPLCAPIVANPDREEVMICDVADGKIKVYNYSGEELSSFQPQTSNEALALQPCSIAVSANGHILVADNLNHCINAYDTRGSFLAQVLNASDSVGPVVACTVGPQGHLILTEYSLNGVHCVKVFRYDDCDCHRARPGSAKKAPRDPPPPTRVIAPSPRKD